MNFCEKNCRYSLFFTLIWNFIFRKQIEKRKKINPQVPNAGRGVQLSHNFSQLEIVHKNMSMRLVIKAARKKPLILIVLWFALWGSMIKGYHQAMKKSKVKKLLLGVWIEIILHHKLKQNHHTEGMKILVFGGRKVAKSALIALAITDFIKQPTAE